MAKKKENNEVEKLEQEKGELKDQLQRLQAEFNNFRERTEKEKSQLQQRANEELIKKILPVVDNLSLALSNHDSKDEFSKGIEMIYSQLIEIMDEEGVKPIKAEGKFNPKYHEAVLVMEGAKDQEIIEEMQRGYTYKDKVLRYSKVKISKKGDKNE